MRPVKVAQTVSQGKIKIHYSADKMAVRRWASNFISKGYHVTIDQTANGWWGAWVDTAKKR